MNRKVYFGNGVQQCWIPAPKTGLKADSNGFSVEKQLNNGRSFVKRSQASHRSFNVSWTGSLNAEAIEDSLHTIKDYADGIYGPGPFYWLDPYAVDTNLLAPHWAAPGLTEVDWPAITSVGTQTFVDTDANSNGYPYKSLVITFSAATASSTRAQRIIIPEGYKMHFGWHGTRTNSSATVTLRCYDRDTGASTDVSTTPLAVTSTQRTNSTVNGNTYSMVDILIENTSATSCSMEIAGMIAQVLPESEAVDRGGFISGRGTTALQFTKSPEIEYYSSAINNGQVGLSASLKESE